LNNIGNVGIHDAATTDYSVNVYPNPSTESVIIKFHNPTKENVRLLLYNMNGQLVRSIEQITTDEVKIDRLNLKNGIYFFKLYNNVKIIGDGKLTFSER
jgi:hypothetical protein